MASSTPSPVPTQHLTSYPRLDPTNPLNSAAIAGKTVAITGGGSGLGLGFAQAFARAGAAHIVIFGRTQATLDAAKDLLLKENPKIKVTTGVADVTSATSVEAAFAQLGDDKIDILVNNAGYLPAFFALGDASGSLDDYWRGFEVNVKGSLNVITSFVPRASPNAVVLNISTGAAHFPASFMKGASAYTSSKIAGERIFATLQAENPDWQVINLHPGVIDTPMYRKSVEGGFKGPSHDGEYQFLSQE